MYGDDASTLQLDGRTDNSRWVQQSALHDVTIIISPGNVHYTLHSE